MSHQWIGFTKEEAQRACDRVNEYWRARGHDVNARIIKMPAPGFDGRRSTFGIRSDLVNGLPPKRKRQAVVI